MKPQWQRQKQPCAKGKSGLCHSLPARVPVGPRGLELSKRYTPFAYMEGRHRNFMEVHLAKSRKVMQTYGCHPCHVFTTSYLTHKPITAWFENSSLSQRGNPIRLSKGKSVGLRFVPTLEDLRFAWELLPQQQLDEQSEKVRRSVRKALMDWAAKNRGSLRLPRQSSTPVHAPCRPLV